MALVEQGNLPEVLAVVVGGNVVDVDLVAFLRRKGEKKEKIYI